jgi:iron complex transport system substrate-binding protein
LSVHKRSALLRILCVFGIFFSLQSTAVGAINLKQADGSWLTLDAPAQRIITLSPHLTELIYAAGAGGLLVSTVEYSEYPQAARQIPRVGDAFRLDIERILALDVDLVIAWDSGNPQKAMQQLRTLNVPVWSVEIREPVEIANVLEAMGDATGNTGPAGQKADAFRLRLNDLGRQYRQATPLDYFYQVGSKPLFTINAEHLISKGLSLCGGRNIFVDQPGLAFQVGHEAVIVADPDIMFAPHSGNDADPLAAWRDWQSMKAVRQGALYLLPADSISQATPRFLDSLELACKLMHQSRESAVDD